MKDKQLSRHPLRLPCCMRILHLQVRKHPHMTTVMLQTYLPLTLPQTQVLAS